MNSRVLYLGDAATARFAIPFPYLSPTHIHVYVNKIEQLNPLDWEFDGDGFVVLKHTPAVKDAVEVIRWTESDVSLSQFHDGSILTEAELNLATLQNLYLNQELRDHLDALLNPAVNNIASNLGVIPATAEEVIDAVVQGILDSTLLADLQQRITDIDTNAESLNVLRTRADWAEDAVNSLNTSQTATATLITTETNERVAGDTALAETLALIGAKNAGGTAFILDLSTAYVSPTLSLADRLEQVNAATGNAISAAVSQETVARTTADSALSATLSTVQTTVGSNTAAIEVSQQAINGIMAEYTIKLDVNGYIAGIGLMNDGATGQVTILADKFSIVTPGKTPVVPFAADANGVYMDNAYIRNLAVDKITGGAIKAFFNIADATGRIVLDTGTYMKVLGSGFGLNGDLIEWFGPKMDVGACTRMNAITFVATNGDAYFGGSLRAGTLYNATNATSVLDGIDAVLGPYDTLGNTKTIVLSYTFSDTSTTTTPPAGSGSDSSPISATLTLYRSIAGGAEELVGTLSVTGVYSRSWEPGVYDQAWNMSGSLTYTDSAAGTGSRTYRAHLARATAGATTDVNKHQNISIISTEQ